jgi:hypothetical protein
MRGPAGRTRSMALALFLMCVGAVRHEAPPIPVASEGAASLVLAESPLASALPASAWTVALDRATGTPPKLGRRRVQPSAPVLPVVAVTRGPVLAASTSTPPSGASLLGLPTAPANAPPGS